jgi:hypothetical protein
LANDVKPEISKAKPENHLEFHFKVNDCKPGVQLLFQKIISRSGDNLLNDKGNIRLL